MGVPNYLKTVVAGVAFGATFMDCVGYVARVEGISMQPALNPDPMMDDYVFLSKWSIRDLEFVRGEVISLISPKDPNQKIIKRIIGLQGDVIPTLGYKQPYIKVPEGHCWVEGDHTGSSLDSNTYGPVSLGLVTAKAKYIVWPPSRWRSLTENLPKRIPINLTTTTTKTKPSSH